MRKGRISRFYNDDDDKDDDDVVDVIILLILWQGKPNLILFLCAKRPLQFTEVGIYKKNKKTRKQGNKETRKQENKKTRTRPRK